MCDVWKNDSHNELSSTDLQKILLNKLFRKVRHVGLSGGEPTLRTDLVNIIIVILESLPDLRSISITSHGFLTKRWQKILQEIAFECQKEGVRFTLNLSLDGIGKVHDQIRRIPGGYRRVIGTYELAKSLGIPVLFQATISKNNIYNVNNLLDTVERKLDSRIEFRIATEIERLNNYHSVREVSLNDNERSFLADFIDSTKLSNITPSPARRLFYKDLAYRLRTNSHRNAPCFYQNEGVLLTAHGDLYHCSISSVAIGNALSNDAYKLYFSSRSQTIRSELLKKKCPSCLHDQSGAWKPLMLVKETLSSGKRMRKIFLLIEAIALSLRALVALIRSMFLSPILLNNNQFSTAMLIGAYGGEHVGDAAILGGVALRIQREFGIRKIVVSSFRPDRTKRWVRSVNLPVKLEVIDHSEAVDYLSMVNCLVWAGGPLMDLPRLVVSHFDLITHAIVKRKPFWLEGVGIGPFKLWASLLIARNILRLASRIRVRTKEGMSHKIVKGFRPELSLDPAFDYLKSRENELQLLEDEYGQINDFIGEGKYLVGINLRPFWSKYLSTFDSVKAQKDFLSSFSNSLIKFHNITSAQFLFFPMNSDQYGFSDLEIAQQLKSQLPPNFPFRIWETEPDIDAVIAFLRRLDLVIAMRFHACIFALSQNLPTIGIDYSQGYSGKVRELFLDAGLEEQVCGITDFHPDWLVCTAQNLMKRF
jgi:polysaccharide pyruvyl transferase WcaK-like protein/sulfatase maturation enzyme AslB (radical SAM superfamily)